jgi:acetyl-CoA carboxylase carboxyl transferase subunit beta
MSWVKQNLPGIQENKKKNLSVDGLWEKCTSCQVLLYLADFDSNQRVCMHCGFHARLSALARFEALADTLPDQWIGQALMTNNPLAFEDTQAYNERVLKAQAQTCQNDALLAAEIDLSGAKIVLAVFEFAFMGGSMGAVVGDIFAQAVEQAIRLKVPFVCVSASGGARMQEGLLALMQMAKVSLVLQELKEAGLPYISILHHSVYGGVSASLAFLGDVIIAEPKAMIGFAGPRVIEQTVKQTLPEGFQTAEFLLEQGAIDAIVHRAELKDYLIRLLKKLSPSFRAQLS